MTFKDQMQADLDIFYNADEFAEEVNIESADGDDVCHDIPVIFDFNDGIRERGSDALAVESTMNVRVSDIETILPGFKVYRSNKDIWHVLDAVKSADGLEWIATISRMSR